MRTILPFLFLGCIASAQVNEPDRLMQAFTDRAMADSVSRMATDERIKMYETLVNYKPGDFHFQCLCEKVNVFVRGHISLQFDVAEHIAGDAAF